jgi:hypothetical protein
MIAAEATLTSEQRATLHSWLAAGKTEQRLAFRQIILVLDEGLSNQAVAERLATRPGQSRPLPAPSAGRIPALHEPRRR